MNAPRREPQAPLDPPAEWWGEEEMEEVEEIGPAPLALQVEDLAVKVKHLQVPSSVLSVTRSYDGTWEIHMRESDFRETYPTYSVESRTTGNFCALVADVHGIRVMCLASVKEEVW
jgi:hypothetical protein